MLLLHSELSYTCEDTYYTFDFRRRTQGTGIAVSQTLEHGRLKVVLHAERPCVLDMVKMTFSYPFDDKTRIFLNGYQSWTDSFEHRIHDRMPGLSRVPTYLQKRYLSSQYGDYNFTEYGKRPGQMHGFTYAYLRQDKQYTLIGSVSERQGFTIIRTDTVHGIVTVEKECSGVVIEGDYPVFDLCIFRGSEEQVFDAYFAAMDIPKCTAKPIVGYTSWYHHYQNITQNLILRNLASLAHSEVKADVFQVDDGYQSFVGDWLSVHPKKFPGGMEIIARSITRQGMIPGLWLAPFVCEAESRLFAEHPDWILRDENGEMVKGGCNWSGFYALDFYHPQVQAYLREVFRVVTQEWGFKLLKLDFLYAVCLLPRKDKTRGQIMCEAMDFLRECAGDALILGCGVPLGAAFGKVDYCRVGPDVTLDWDNTPLKRLLHRERDSTKNTILNSVYRRQLNGRAFINDPDVFLLRKENTTLTAHQKTWLSKINAVCGGVLLTSDEIGRYNENQMEALQELLAMRGCHVLSAEQMKDKLVVCCEKDYEVHSIVIPLSGKA